MKSYLKLFSAVCLGFIIFWSCDSSSGEEQSNEKIPVEVMPVKRGNIVQSITYTGDVKAEYEINVFSKIPDRIEKFYVDEGDHVTKGAPLARIFATTMEQNVKQVEASLISARAQENNLRLEYERAQRLHNEDAMSKQQYDAIKTQYASAQAQVEQAEAVLNGAQSQLKDALVTAPITGIIGKRYFETGDMAAPSMPLLRIVQMERVRVEFNATEQDLGRLAVGQKAAIFVKAFPDTVFPGYISKISPILDPVTRMAEVEVLAENNEKFLKPGMFATVDVTTNILKNVLVVPRYASLESTTLQKVNGQDQVLKNYYIFKIKDNRAFRQKLDIGYINHISLAVDGGVAEGDSVVIAGQNNLRDSMLVSIAMDEGEEQ